MGEEQREGEALRGPLGGRVRTQLRTEERMNLHSGWAISFAQRYPSLQRSTEKSLILPGKTGCRGQAVSSLSLGYGHGVDAFAGML